MSSLFPPRRLAVMPPTIAPINAATITIIYF
jgi:hypothetical protein